MNNMNEMRRLMNLVESIERGEILEEGVKEWVQAAIISLALAGSPQGFAADSSTQDPASIPNVITQQADKHRAPSHAQSINVAAKQADIKNAMYPAIKNAFPEYGVFLDNGPTTTISIKKGDKYLGFVRIYPLGIDKDNYGLYAQVTYGDGTFEKSNKKFKEEQKLGQAVQQVINALPTPTEKEAAKSPEQRKNDAVIAAIKANEATFDAAKWKTGGESHGDGGHWMFQVKPAVVNGKVTTDYTIYISDNSVSTDSVLFTRITQDDFNTIRSELEKLSAKKIPPFDGDVPSGDFRKKSLGQNRAQSMSFSVARKGEYSAYYIYVSDQYQVNTILFSLKQEEVKALAAAMNQAESKAQEIIDYLASEIE